MNKSEAAKKRWENPEYRDRMLKIMNSDEYKAKMSDVKTGHHDMTEDGKKSVSEKATKRWADDEFRESAKNAMKGKHHTNGCEGREYSQETKTKISDARKREWNKTEYVKAMMLARNAQPNKDEQKLNNALQEKYPHEWGYNGDFRLGVSLSGMIPDFVNVNGKKKVIELFGDYWHSDEVVRGAWKRTEFGRIAAYKQLGYDTLIIWGHELKDIGVVMDRIEEFMEK